MGSKFPESGLAAILDLTGWSPNVQKYLKDSAAMDRADQQAAKSSTGTAKALKDQAKSTKDASKPTEKLAGSMSKLLSQTGLIPPGLTKIVGGFKGFDTSIGEVIGGLDKLGLSLGSKTVMLGALAAAAAVATAALFKLGMRGAALPGIIQAFDISGAKAGMLSQTLLGDLRSAARGTVSDINLMKSANIALAGASGEVGKALGQGGLAGLMKIAQTQSKATGQSTDFLFQSLVSGVKRSSPMLIDNTGLVLKVGEANEKYAASVGKTVKELSAQDKQIAILNATLEAGREAVETYGSGALTAADRMARIQTRITNFLDRAAIAVQPLFNLILAIGETLLSAVIAPIDKFLIPIVYELSNAIFGPLLSAWEGLTGMLSNIFAPVAQLIHRWLVVIVGVIRGFGFALNWLVAQAGKVLGPLAGIIRDYVISPITSLLDPVKFAEYAGNVFGAFAEGILWAANTLIFPAVIGIAQFIADFLMGFSPPRRGPLAQIDKGGANIMGAWLDGLSGVPLTPVAQMTAQVNNMLGDIGHMSYGQVQNRLSALDRALQPFIDNLEIAKAKMQALVEPLTAAQDAIKNKLGRTVKDFFGGDASLAEVRALDAQNEAISRQIGMYEDMTAEAEYQLAMMQARQAVERSLLGIQARRRKGQQGQAAGRAGAEERAGAGAGAGGGTASDSDTADESTGAGGGFDWSDFAQDDPTGSYLSGITDDEISAMWGNMAGGFASGLNNTGFAGQLAQFEQNRSQLSGVFGDIAGSKPFQGLSDTFDNVFGSGPDSLRTKVSGFADDVKSIFTDDIPNALSSFSLDSIRTTFQDAFFFDTAGIPSYLNRFKGTVRDLFNVSGIIDSIFEAFSLDSIRTMFQDAFFFDTAGIPSYLNRFKETVRDLFNIGGIVDLIFSSFSLLPLVTTFTSVFFYSTSGLGGLLTGFKTRLEDLFSPSGLIQGILDAFSLDNFLALWSGIFGSEGILRGLLTGFGETLTGFFKWEEGGFVFDLVVAMGNSFEATILTPIKNALNAVITAIWNALKLIFDQWNSLLDNVLSANEGWLGDALIPDGAVNALSALQIHLGDPPLLRKGGFMSEGGLARVHGGEVLAGSNSPYTVFPARWVTAMERIADSMTRFAPPPRSGSQPIVIDRTGGGMTVNQNFNGTGDSVGVRRTMYELQALGVFG